MALQSVDISATTPAFNLTSRWKTHITSDAYIEYETLPQTVTKNAIFGVFLPANSVVKSAYIHSEWGTCNTGYAIKSVDGKTPDSNGNVAVPLDASNGTKTFEFKFKPNGSLTNPGVSQSSAAQISNIYLHIEYEGEELSDDTKALTGTATAGDSDQHWLKGTGNTGEAYSFTISGIPSGAVVTKSTFSFYNGNTTRAPGYSRVYWGNSASGTSLWAVSGCANANVSVDITGRISGNGTYSLYLYATKRSDSAQYYSYFQNIGITVEYTYYITIGKATAPATVLINNTNSAYVAQNKTATLTWSAGSGGENNAITGYKVYQNGSLYSSLGTSTTSLSIPASTAGTYLWTVRTAAAEKDSSDSTGAYLYSYSAPTAPTSVIIEPSTTVPGGNAVLSWSGETDGIHNPIASFSIYRSTSEAGDKVLQDGTTEHSYNVVAPDSDGHTHYYTIVCVGTRDSTYSAHSVQASLTAYEGKAYPPYNCVLDCAISHNSVNMTWAAPYNDPYNQITGYKIQKRESSDRENWEGWVDVGTTTSTSLSVAPSPTYGNYYQFRIQTITTYGDSSWTICANTLRREHKPLDDYEDATLVVRETPIKAIHMTQLQDNANALLSFYSLEKEEFSNIVAGETSLAGWTSHVQELRDAMDKLTTEHQNWIVFSTNSPTTIVMQQLRDVLLEIESPSVVLDKTKLNAGRLG